MPAATHPPTNLLDDADLAQRLRLARTTAGLSRARLAELTGLSESTLKNAESGRHALSTATYRALLRVPQLNLAAPPSPPTASLNAWIAPGFHPIELYRSMARTLSGAGGHLEQTYAYFDHASAAAWCAIASQPDYALAHASLPIEAMAEAIAARLGGAPLDLVALGPGDGRLEIRLAAAIAARLRQPVGRLFLLDISQPLLSAAYQLAADSLGPSFPALTPIAVQGDFHHLPEYSQLYLPRHRHPVVCLLGGTFSNLDHEVRFVRDSLCGFPEGSLLLIDYPGLFGESDAEIQRCDPWLSDTSPLSWRARAADFLTGPLRRYCPQSGDITLSAQLERSGAAIAGSYAVEVLARVAPLGGSAAPERIFRVFRLKRYRTEPVLAALQALGWSHQCSAAFGQDAGYPRTLSLFQRLAPPPA